jgi:hypothetical protein
LQTNKIEIFYNLKNIKKKKSNEVKVRKAHLRYYTFPDGRKPRTSDTCLANLVPFIATEMKNIGTLFTFLTEIITMVKKKPGGRQVAAGHGMHQGCLLA